MSYFVSLSFNTSAAEGPQVEFNADRFRTLSVSLRKYADEDDVLQVEILNAAQVTVAKLNHPPGMCVSNCLCQMCIAVICALIAITHACIMIVILQTYGSKQYSKCAEHCRCWHFYRSQCCDGHDNTPTNL